MSHYRQNPRARLVLLIQAKEPNCQIGSKQVASIFLSDWHDGVAPFLYHSTVAGYTV
jgi:hypothetical protein